MRTGRSRPRASLAAEGVVALLGTALISLHLSIRGGRWGDLDIGGLWGLVFRYFRNDKKRVSVPVTAAELPRGALYQLQVISRSLTLHADRPRLLEGGGQHWPQVAECHSVGPDRGLVIIGG